MHKHYTGNFHCQKEMSWFE